MGGIVISPLHTLERILAIESTTKAIAMKRIMLARISISLFVTYKFNDF